jgi:DNA-binding MarR family transcriptional regulator
MKLTVASLRPTQLLARCNLFAVTIERLSAEIERLQTHLIRAGGTLGDTEGSSLTLRQRLALRTIVDEGPLRLGELASRIGTTDPTATRTVDALEQTKLVRRSAAAGDRRGVRVEATTKGMKTIRELQSRRIDLLRRLLEDAPADQIDRAADLLGQLNSRLTPTNGTLT